MDPTTDGHFNGPAQRVFEIALQEAELMGRRFVGPEHLLLGILKEGDNIGTQALRSFRLDAPTIGSRILELITAREAKLKEAEEKTQEKPEEKRSDPFADLKAMMPTLQRMASVFLEDIAGRLR